MTGWNNIQLPPSMKQVNIPNAVAGALLAGTAVAGATLWLVWHQLPWMPLPAEPLTIHFGYWFKGLMFRFSHGHFFVHDWSQYKAYLDTLDQKGLSQTITWRWYCSGATGLGAFFYTFLRLAKPIDQLIHIRGRQLYAGTEAIEKANIESKAEIINSGAGICLHLRIPISLEREKKHILVMGGVGSGKTQVIWHLLNQAIARGDRVIVYDNKGEFTESLRGRLFAPWDARSSAWDIAADCLNKSDAREVAARLIPENEKDPMWSNASRSILTGMIVYLQATRGRDWGFRDLEELIAAPLPEIERIMRDYHHEGLRSVEDAGKTTQSILINLSAFMQVIFDLSDAWGDTPQKKRISLRDWLDDKIKSQVLILQGSGNHALLTKGYVKAMVATVGAHVASPSFANSTSRKIWLFLDELPQLGRIEHLDSLLETGRSKGFRVVIGIQDVAQIEKIYGRQDMDAWVSMMGTTIYGRVSGGNTAKWIAERIGEREVERPNEVLSYRGAILNRSLSFGREMIPIVLPSQLNSDLGLAPAGVRMLLDGFSHGVYRVSYPFANMPKLNKAVVPALWVQPTAASGGVTPVAAGASEVGIVPTATAVTTAPDSPAQKKFRRRDELSPERQIGDGE